jgi:hypothetical protein
VTPITIWMRFAEPRGPFEFNHIESGHCSPMQRIPTIKHENQRRNWTRALWIQRHAYLDSDRRVVDTSTSTTAKQ